MPIGHLRDLVPACSRLPGASADQLIGAARIISHAGGRMSQEGLAAALRFDDEQIVGVVELLMCLDLVDAIGSDILLTDVGNRVASSAIPERRRLFAELAMHLPIVRQIMDALAGAATGSLERSKLLDVLGAESCPADEERVLDHIVAWGRYARLFSYDAKKGQVFLL